ncbi:CatB-related O-acetyltransferase [Pseudomonas sp. 21LCFQ02]|uniref:CatB-related O-acetyltransferase n=1 Tax=unclassified Pseudomonas TaxID=196821 RepID=UPI0004F927F9|nr:MULTISPECIES: CatB-related O-acetyltransferase [unclassified Pseudomonas]MCO8161512.1 CatB-related O-acetyltransferase [Pseudomonas sp. 21LCFQ010]MCO8171115.1 CatB-related O-acetyltransferase [Pseudomonas sp. 21LCFQ02]MCQ9423818.1 CatB-related O-acetyltransferase [Pseudomonas sp. LJDD11]BAP41344.1 acetyltransferase [Pseudomonas sp. StFLB209]
MKFLELLKERKTRKRLRSMDKLDRSAEKIRLRYPRYTVGVGTYGIPEVLEFGDDTVLKVGSYTSIADGVRILLGGEHRTDWLTTYPFPAMIDKLEDIKDYAPSKGDVVIGSDCWICADAVILSGVTIGHGAIVAAGAMVTRDVPPYSVVGGNPCKFIRWRFEEQVREELLQAAWWDWPVDEVKSVARTLCSADLQAFLTYIRRRKAAEAVPVG